MELSSKSSVVKIFIHRDSTDRCAGQTSHAQKTSRLVLKKAHRTTSPIWQHRLISFRIFPPLRPPSQAPTRTLQGSLAAQAIKPRALTIRKTQKNENKKPGNVSASNKPATLLLGHL